MNERIKELKDQCWVERRWNNDMWIEKHIDLELFAELIIRECAEVCYDHSRAAGGVDTDFGYGYKDCGDDIKRNFGVKE